MLTVGMAVDAKTCTGANVSADGQRGKSLRSALERSYNFQAFQYHVFGFHALSFLNNSVLHGRRSDPLASARR